jgi:hypothetical protein
VGFEPTTPGSEDRCSGPLSYRRPLVSSIIPYNLKKHHHHRAFKRGEAPLYKKLPPLLLKALSGEGDTGGEVKIYYMSLKYFDLAAMLYLY